MSKQAVAGNTSARDTRYWVKAIIGLALIFGIQFIPAPAPITQPGMAVIGMFVGLIWMITAVDKVWPTFAVICLFSFYAFDIYPDSTASSPVYETVIQSFGNWIVLFIVTMLLLCEALQQVGLLRRMTLWFITRKVAQKGPWALTTMMLLATLVVGAIMDCTPTAMVMIVIAHEVFNAFGFKEGDEWPQMIIAAIPMTVTIAFGMTPIGHNLVIAVMDIVAAASGESINMVQYMLIGVPVGLILFAILILYFKYFVKPDTSKFNDVDFSGLRALKPGKMSAQEKIVAVVACAVLLFWLAPGVLGIVAPDSSILAFVNEMTMLYPVMAAIALLAFIHIDGKPILNMSEALNKISWTPTFMFASVVMIATALRQDTVGVIDWVDAYVAPAVAGFSPFVMVLVLAAITVAVTNFLNNTAVGMLFATACAPFALSVGVNPVIVAVVIALGSNLAYTTPAASFVATFSVTDPYCNGGYVLRHGIVMAVISVIVCGILCYPLGSMLF